MHPGLAPVVVSDPHLAARTKSIVPNGPLSGALGHSMSNIDVIVETADLQNFLGAEVGMGASGERLTVALALSHMGFDPVLEAERLSALSRASAAGELAEVIVSTPGSLWEFSTAVIMSEHLVRLLPVHLAAGGV
jgi:hypothetical protein